MGRLRELLIAGVRSVTNDHFLLCIHLLFVLCAHKDTVGKSGYISNR